MTPHRRTTPPELPATSPAHSNRTAPDILPGVRRGPRTADFGRVSEQTRWEVAKAVGEGADTMPAVAEALKTTKTTASHALRHLTDDGYVERHTFPGTKVLFSYKLVKMPPAPKPKRGRTLAASVPVFAPDPKHSTAALEACLRSPALPEGRLVVVHRLGD